MSDGINKFLGTRRYACSSSCWWCDPGRLVMTVFDCIRQISITVSETSSSISGGPGFAALGRVGDYLLLGAVVVIPLFIILRLFSYRTVSMHDRSLSPADGCFCVAGAVASLGLITGCTTSNLLSPGSGTGSDQTEATLGYVNTLRKTGAFLRFPATRPLPLRHASGGTHGRARGQDAAQYRLAGQFLRSDEWAGPSRCRPPKTSPSVRRTRARLRCLVNLLQAS